MGKSYERPTGVSLPFKGQPLQGHSASGDARRLVLGAHRQRHGLITTQPIDAVFERHQIDWATGKIERRKPSSCTIPTRKCLSVS
jgi:hypothetical protein